MDFFDILTMAGGLALFLYGMNLLGEGLAKFSGGRFEQVLERLTGNPLKAVLLGAGVTAVIQSSSAATVMVVGFVNSGIMSLRQAVGVIMGANVGTTVTSWILGLTGIDSASFLVRLCKPSSFSPILAAAGVGMLLFSRRDRLKNAAGILVGFGILMFGMDTMSNAVKPLAQVPEFTGILTRFSNPFLGMLAGLLLTAVVQSSSASVGILQALCATGAVGYAAAVPIIMGQNIGTCVTALLSGAGANKNAKRAALVHLYFNVIGTALFMLGFFAVNAVQPLGFLEDAATPFGIAAVHSVFNLAATACLLPFSGALVKLACLTIREETRDEEAREDEVLQLLDPRFLEMPAYAVEQSRAVSVSMAGLAEDALELSVSLLADYRRETADRVTELESRVDKFEDQLGSYLMQLGARDMKEEDNGILTTVLHCIGDFERISDHARNVKEAAEEMHGKELSFSEKAGRELEVLAGAVREILRLAVRSFAEGDRRLAGQVEPLEEVIDELNREIRKRHIRRLRKGKCTVELGFLLSDVTTNLERVADHCSNIALCVLQEGEEFDPHACLEELRAEDNMEFQGKVMAYRQKYRLP